MLTCSEVWRLENEIDASLLDREEVSAYLDEYYQYAVELVREKAPQYLDVGLRTALLMRNS